jgi:hypothetical protein
MRKRPRPIQGERLSLTPHRKPQRDDAGKSNGECHIVREDCLELRPRRSRPIERTPKGHLVALQRQIQRGGQELLFALEVEADRGSRNACLFGDGTQGGAAQAMKSHRFDRRLEQRRPGRFSPRSSKVSNGHLPAT